MDAPDIVKILQEEERLGLLCNKQQTCIKEQPTSKISLKTKQDKTIEGVKNSINQNQSKEKLEHYQKKIEEQIKQLKKLDKIKSNFLNITSHELRTPISAIKGYIQMILKEKLGEINDEQKKSLEIALRNANRLDNLIQDLLDISRLDSGRMKFIPEKTNINNMIKETVETMKTLADKKQIKINTMIDQNLPDLTIDGERIKQVIINLLNNAIKFSPNSSTIKIYVRKKQDEILVEIEDLGRGIPENQKDNIFDAFYQVKSNEDKKLGGVGLGLAISRGIILAHGGRIWIESTIGKGSKFTFTLPLKSVQDIEGKLKNIDVFRVEE
jgi:signal transduction histidine kinase